MTIQTIATRARKFRPLIRPAKLPNESDAYETRVVVFLKPDQQIRSAIWCGGLVAEYNFPNIDKARRFWVELGKLLAARPGKNVSVPSYFSGVDSTVHFDAQVARDLWVELGLVINNAHGLNK